MDSNQHLASDTQSSIHVPPGIRDWPLEQMKLSVRLQGVLQRLGCLRLGDLHGLTWGQLGRTKNCGRKTIVELQAIIAELQAGRLEQPGAHPGQPEHRQPAPTSVFVPPNACGWSLSDLPVSVRLAGVLERMNCSRLGDLQGLSFLELKKMKNCGQRTITELRIFISRVQAGEFDLAMSEGRELDLTYLVLSLNEGIGRLNPRERDMFLLRLGGLGDEPLILAEIGVKYGLTREGVRVTVNKVIAQLSKGGGLRGNQVLKMLAEKCVVAVCPMTPELFTHWLGAEASVCCFKTSFYVRLLGELLPEIPAWPGGQKTGVNISKKSKQIVSCLPEVLRSKVAAVPLREALEELNATGDLTDIQAAEFLEALQHDESVKVEFILPDQPTVRLSGLRPQDQR